jgi:hypothetical protein
VRLDLIALLTASSDVGGKNTSRNSHISHNSLIKCRIKTTKYGVISAIRMGYVEQATSWTTGVQFPAGAMMGFFSPPSRPYQL